MRVWQILVRIVKLDAKIHKAPQGFYGFFERKDYKKKPGPIFTKLALPGVQTLDKNIE